MLIPILIATAVTIHAGSNSGSQNGSPSNSPQYRPVCHVPLLENDLNLGPSYTPSTPPVTMSKVIYGHMNFGRVTPTGDEMSHARIKTPKAVKACACLLAAIKKS